MPGNPIYHDPRWKLCRRATLVRDHYRCTVPGCGVSVAGKGQSRVDHIIRISDGGAAFDVDNCRTLCVLHDNQSHREKQAGGSGPRVERFVVPGSTADGTPIDPAHPWNRRASGVKERQAAVEAKDGYGV